MNLEIYDVFVEEWQDKYGPRPVDYVPGIDSDDFKEWLISNYSCI